MRQKRSFLYTKVAAELRRRIETGEYKPGDAVPPEAALTAAFGVSAITVRRAVMELMYEGLLYGRQGLGVFVADRRKIVRILGGDATVSLGNEIARAGLSPGIRELGWSRVPATKDLAQRLAVRQGASICQHEKVVLADDEPVAIDSALLKKQLADKLHDRLGQEFVFPALADLGIRIGRAEFRFEGMAASERQADLLNLTPYFPLVIAHYLLFDSQGEPTLSGFTASRSDRMVFDLSTVPQCTSSVMGSSN